MKVSVRERDGVNILYVEGRIDINASEIIETVGWLLKNGRHKMLCNFQKVDVVDYSGLSILAITYKNVINHNGMMRFCCVPLHINQLLKIVRLDAVFQIYRSEDAAIKSFDEHSAVECLQLRRRFKRVYMHASVNFCPIVAKGRPQGKRHSGKLMNLSGEGLFIYTKHVLPMGSRVKIEMPLKEKNKPIEVDGTVIWRADKMLQPQSFPGMGIQFRSIRKEKQSRILRYLDKHLTLRSRSSKS